MLKKALKKRSMEKALKEMLKEALRKVIFLKEVLKIVFLLKKVFPKNMVLESNKILKKFTNTLKKVLKKALQKAFKVKSSQKSAKKKYSEKLLGSRIGSKKSRLTKKNAQQSFFGQTSSHKREGSKKYSKWGNSLEIYIETLYDRQTSGMTGCYWTHQQKL